MRHEAHQARWLVAVEEESAEQFGVHELVGGPHRAPGRREDLEQPPALGFVQLAAFLVPRQALGDGEDVTAVAEEGRTGERDRRLVQFHRCDDGLVGPVLGHARQVTAGSPAADDPASVTRPDGPCHSQSGYVQGGQRAGQPRTLSAVVHRFENHVAAAPPRAADQRFDIGTTQPEGPARVLRRGSVTHAATLPRRTANTRAQSADTPVGGTPHRRVRRLRTRVRTSRTCVRSCRTGLP